MSFINDVLVIKQEEEQKEARRATATELQYARHYMKLMALYMDALANLTYRGNRFTLVWDDGKPRIYIGSKETLRVDRNHSYIKSGRHARIEGFCYRGVEGYHDTILGKVKARNIDEAIEQIKAIVRDEHRYFEVVN